jgi:CRP-like cAMP-binding protein
VDSFLHRKLAHFAPLTGDDRQALDARLRFVHRFGPHEDLFRHGEDPRHVNVILEGWACRYKQFEDGRRQTLALFLPGDMCDPHVFLLDRMSHSLGSLTPVTVARIPFDEISGLMDFSATLHRALLLEVLITTEVQREWTLSLGRRTSLERLAHLFCELALRLRSVGLTDRGSFDLPLTQADLADALGLSTVHVNRMLQELRATGLVEQRARRLTIYDEQGLRALAMFDPSYLHLNQIALL